MIFFGENIREIYDFNKYFFLFDENIITMEMEEEITMEMEEESTIKMEEESYLLVQILEKQFERYRKALPDEYQRMLTELSSKNLTNNFTSEVDKAIKFLIDEDYSNESVFDTYLDLLESNISSLQQTFNWELFLKRFIHYLGKGIIDLNNGNDTALKDVFQKFLKVLEHHKKKGTHNIYSWRVLGRTATCIVEAGEKILRERAAVEKQDNDAIREFVSRTIEYIYRLYLVDPPPKLQEILNEFPENRHVFLLGEVYKAAPLLLNDLELQTKIDNAEDDYDTRLILESCVYRSKTAAEKYWENRNSDYSLCVFESSMNDFKAAKEKLGLSNVLFQRIQLAIKDILATYNENSTNVTHDND